MDTKNKNTESKNTESKNTGSKNTGSKNTEDETTKSNESENKSENTEGETTESDTIRNESENKSENTEGETTKSDTIRNESENKSENTEGETTKSENTRSEKTKKTKSKNTKKIKKTKSKNTKSKNTESRNTKINNTKWNIVKNEFSDEVSLGEASIQELVIGFKFASIQKKTEWGKYIKYKEKWRKIWEPVLKILEDLYKTLQTLKGEDYDMLHYVLCGAFSWKYQQRKLWEAVDNDIYIISDTLCQNLRSARGYIHEWANGEYQMKLLEEFNNLVDMLGKKNIRTYEYIDRKTRKLQLGKRFVEDMTKLMRKAVKDIQEEYKTDKKE